MSSRVGQGGRYVDRDQVLTFRWEGGEYTGHPGDTLASALLANGIRVVGRSFKYHRPRGVMSAGTEESGALVTLGVGPRRDPNVKATETELYDGLQAHGQNAWPSLRFDLGALNDRLSRFLQAGFYYKTFMGIPPLEWGRGTGAWMWYEKWIRRAAGMGKASRAPDPDAYEQTHRFCDVLVVGTGPAGLAAAQAAAEAGADVLVVEQDFLPGGALLSDGGETSATLRRNRLQAIEAAGATIMTRTTVFGLYDHGVAGLIERVTDHLPAPPGEQPRQRFWIVRTRRIILATGAIERHLAFGDNDRPGILTAAAGRTYLNRFGVLPGRRIAVATNNDSIYTGAMDLANAGADVVVLDGRDMADNALVSQAERCGVTVYRGKSVSRAHGGNGVSLIEVSRRRQGAWMPDGSLACDALLVSGGWSPAIALHSQRGALPVWNEPLGCFLPGETDEAIDVAGAAAGVWTTEACDRSGAAAGSRAAAAVGYAATPKETPERGGWAQPLDALYEVPSPRKHVKSFVDFQHDVTADDIRLACREGYVSVEHLKRYTTLGMATDQGKMGNVLGIALMAEQLGQPISAVGTTTFRPPYTPVSLGALTGRAVDSHFKPLRRTPMHDWHLAQGAVMTEAGLWQRPWYYPRRNESLESAYIREAALARNTVALCDVTSLGKIAVQGPDAGEFLNRVYVNALAKLSVGKARYGIMLRDDGIVMDDGTIWRLGETDYFVTTTTAHAATVLAWLEELLEVRWPALKARVTSITDQWAGCAVAGPQSRTLLSQCLKEPDRVDSERLPFMGVTEARLRGDIPCRIARISFSGELAFEAYVPSDYGPAMMDLLWQEAKTRSGGLYGLEALGTLRIEKGHLTGAELDGRVTLEDAGLGRMASGRKHAVGSALRQRPALQQDDRPRLVGIFPRDRGETFNAGALLCRENAVEGFGEGWITAVTHSPALGHWIGLGFIQGGVQHWQDKGVVAADPIRKQPVAVEIVAPTMYDPEGDRLHG